MGGRGGFFKSFQYEKSGDYSPFEDMIYKGEEENFEKDEDTKLEHNGITKKLLDKNIHIKQSTDNFNSNVLIPNIDKVDKLSSKYLDTSRILKKNDKEFSVRADVLSNGTEACFRSYANSLSKMRIVLNRDNRLSTIDNIENRVKSNIEAKHWVKCDKENLVSHTITHEFGHYVQRVLMEREKHTKKGSRFFEEFENKVRQNPEQFGKLQHKYYEDHAQRVLNSIDNLQYKNLIPDLKLMI